ncbi:MAG: hypothetical protein JEZ12_17290 [Desulfobacterium sp.]|nr:hypothetical protein [Desulfobacterium sp.]
MVRFFLLFLMLVTAGGCAWNPNPDPVPRQPRDWRSIPEIAESLYREKHYPEALTTLLGADPKLLEDQENRRLLWRINHRLVTVQWYLQKAIIALVKGEKDAARLEVDKALTLYPDHEPSLKLHRALDAITIVKPLPKELPPTSSPPPAAFSPADYFLALGRSYLKKGDLELAKRAWRKGLDIVPSHGEIIKQLKGLLVNQGLRLFGQGDFGASIGRWEEALRLAPDDPEIKGYLDRARKATEKLRSIDP